MTEPIAGTLNVSNEVIADIAGYAAMSCYGVVGMAEQLQGAESVRLLAGQRLRKGVLVTASEDGLTVDLHVVIEPESTCVPSARTSRVRSRSLYRRSRRSIRPSSRSPSTSTG